MKMNLPNIPIFAVSDRPLEAKSQSLLAVAEIIENMVLLKDGGACLILESTSLNFGLLSEKEQQAVIAAYAALLNSLSFSVQILVRSQRKNISQYLNYLDQAQRKIQNPKLKNIMVDYRNFITTTIQKKNVLSKKFYVILPFSNLELGITKSFLSSAKTKGPLPYPKSYVLKKARTVLEPKKTHLIRQAGRLGLKLRQLTQYELVELFYDAYNPKPPAKKQKGKENGAA